MPPITCIYHLSYAVAQCASESPCGLAYGAHAAFQGELSTDILWIFSMFNTANNERIIRLKTVLARTGLSRSTLYRKIADGTFPRQIPISLHGAGWHESAVNRWIADPRSYRDDGLA